MSMVCAQHLAFLVGVPARLTASPPRFAPPPRCCLSPKGDSVPTSTGAEPSAAQQPRAPPPTVPTASQEALLVALRTELPALFSPASPGPNLALYAPSVLFTDPLNRFRGARRYAANIAFLRDSPVFRQSRLMLHNAWFPEPPPGNAVRTRWTLDMVANLPWRPRVVFTGTSDYILDQDGKIAAHVDRWDSLQPEQNKFPSLAAVRDLLAQCAYKARVPDPLDDPQYLLLRRSRDYVIRLYASVDKIRSLELVVSVLPNDFPAPFTESRRLTQNPESPFSVLTQNRSVSLARCQLTSTAEAVVQNSPATESSELTVAAMLLDDAPSSRDQIVSARDRLIRMLTSEKSATLSCGGREPCIWIVRYPSSRSHPEYYELWLELWSFNSCAS